MVEHLHSIWRSTWIWISLKSEKLNFHLLLIKNIASLVFNGIRMLFQTLRFDGNLSPKTVEVLNINTVQDTERKNKNTMQYNTITKLDHCDYKMTSKWQPQLPNDQQTTTKWPPWLPNDHRDYQVTTVTTRWTPWLPSHHRNYQVTTRWTPWLPNYHQMTTKWPPWLPSDYQLSWTPDWVVDELLKLAKHVCVSSCTPVSCWKMAFMI